MSILFSNEQKDRHNISEGHADQVSSINISRAIPLTALDLWRYFSPLGIIIPSPANNR